MTFYLDPEDYNTPQNIASIVGPIDQSPYIQTFDKAIQVKFDRLISVPSLIRATVTLQTNTTTPVVIPNAFTPISPANYNSLARILQLFFFAGVQPATNYTLTISGLTDPAGNAIAPYVWNFQTGASTILTSAPTPDPVYIEDHSIKTDAFTDFNSVIQTNPGFYVLSTTPDPTEEAVVPVDFNNGVVSVTFSVLPDPQFLNFNYFQFQQKIIARGMHVWRTVPNAVFGPTTGTTVPISVPSLSATPVISVPGAPTPPVFNYYDNDLGNYGQAYIGAPYPTTQFGDGYGTPDLMFFLDGYKYRLKIAAGVGYTDHNGVFNPLGKDQVIQFLVDPQPMALDPTEFIRFYPDASLYEIAELVAQYSREAENILHYLVTDTLGSLMDSDSIIAQTVQDFVQAATLASLSRIYEIGAGAQQTEIALGDLRVATNNGLSLTQGMINRANATTWTQLAAIIRDELYQLSKKSGMQAVVRAVNQHNPMPRRHIKHAEWRNWEYGSPYFSKPGT